MTPLLHERSIILADGRRIALLDNAQQGRPLLIALHGWLDNSASFLPLAPYLDEFHLICVDLPGHGHSDHKTTPYVFVDWLDDLYQLTLAAGWQHFTLLGHSLGAYIAAAYAGVFPEQIARLLLLEGLGPLSQPDDMWPARLRQEILQRCAPMAWADAGFASVAEAVKVRCMMTKMKSAAARLICERQLVERDGRWHWRSDPRLRESSSLRMSDGQVMALLQAISCPVLFMQAEQGFNTLPALWQQRSPQFQQIERLILAGDHHFHMDNPVKTAFAIETFCGLR
ncbi:alpha/beta fold hydrolase [Aeromonas cavernicola]|uniref:Alpha/beta hydrolase n=1 Tax=Aeromonas cavernicola TaxID=1006623 RepID=A0A2H9U8E2_9GAMM|nr:alpha/beta hydrolase [Aeromonas cavernicola]PJG60272.1 alpha/beta hydrolase [Aeromonas cavernicola]